LDHKKLKLSLRKEINKNYTKHFIPPPKLTAKSYIIYEVKQRREDSKVIVSFNSKNSQEVASLTKIMTCIVSL
jgi:D-alanyl-D-alanine carboxypeptidase